MIDFESDPGSWRDALYWRETMNNTIPTVSDLSLKLAEKLIAENRELNQQIRDLLVDIEIKRKKLEDAGLS